MSFRTRTYETGLGCSEDLVKLTMKLPHFWAIRELRHIIPTRTLSFRSQKSLLASWPTLRNVFGRRSSLRAETCKVALSRRCVLSYVQGSNTHNNALPPAALHARTLPPATETVTTNAFVASATTKTLDQALESGTLDIESLTAQMAAQKTKWTQEALLDLVAKLSAAQASSLQREAQVCAWVCAVVQTSYLLDCLCGWLAMRVFSPSKGLVM